MAEERTFKKYANRRLYDPTAGRYVTLDDIRRLNMDGVQTKVVDAKTAEDLSRSILLQIIPETAVDRSVEAYRIES